MSGVEISFKKEVELPHFEVIYTEKGKCPFFKDCPDEPKCSNPKTIKACIMVNRLGQEIQEKMEFNSQVELDIGKILEELKFKYAFCKDEKNTQSLFGYLEEVIDNCT